MLILNKEYPIFPYIWKTTYGSIIKSKGKLTGLFLWGVFWLFFLALSSTSTIQQRHKPEF